MCLRLPVDTAICSTTASGTFTVTRTDVPFGVTYEKIGTIQRRLAWPLHKDDTLSRSGRPTGLNIYFVIATGSKYFLTQYAIGF
ncbi:hypothetical protein GY45DRAFT_1246166 [Cubamyces sp. BRFM 1775]|nr:hypothetical protein GY45DRAFT_1246166 [Cubamyces sp. BRFM 1775]